MNDHRLKPNNRLSRRLSDIKQAILRISDMKNFEEINDVWNAWIGSQNPPVRACGETKLAKESLLVVSGNHRKLVNLK